ncbi:dentin sialophosphoprotein-like [Macadamia integrifolia]|uniref:dentin sialophosphoprotein-like n=1 Tax=Macadamia integrifolia TaxID=60698 RepID=UPI001C4EDA53|nr:dentin sialophosphoprotein-like [Macadamia integrifolia]XP_042504522.1 dentin sialophosphoprotein-like [Macadamia integrifolia]
MASSERELEEQLKEAGERLVHPSPNVDELLPLLDQVENCLSRVEQSPSKSMQNALCTSMKALIADDLLRHSDIDVKVAVASCISEITRITAPDAPYDDEQMKEIFQLIVGAFEKLFDTTSRSYSKRVSILETVAKVRSCVVMLDLECDALILEMFQHFLKAVRDDHPENVFSAMETIMTLVLEESEDISVELLSPLLDSVKKENKDFLPIAQKLGKKVIGNCVAKLKPYMVEAIDSLGVSINDYSDIVASICRETSDAAECNKANASGEHPADESNKLLEKAGADEPPQEANELPAEVTGSGSLDPAMDKSPKSVMSNGNAQHGNDDSLTDPSSPKKKPERSRRTNQAKSTDGAAKTEPDSLDSEKVVKPETKPDKATRKTRGRKANPLMTSTEGSDHSRIDHVKGSVELPDRRKSRTKEADSATSGGPSTKDVTVSSEAEKESLAQASSPAASASEPINVASSPTQTTDGTRSRKGRRGSEKKGSRNQDAAPGSPPKGDSLSDHGEDETTPSAAKKKSEGMSDSEAKQHKRTGKKLLAGNVNEKTPTPVDTVSKKESGATKDSDVKSLRKSGKKVDGKNTNVDESSRKQQGGKNKRGRGKTVSDKDVVEESSKKVKDFSPKSATKSLNKDESQVEDTPKISSKRKRTPGKEEHGAIDYDESLVGSKVKVYWPQDRLFYEGTISAFDPVKMKHKVSYTDGDVELLNLSKQRWQFIKDDDVAGEQETDLPSPDASDDMHRKKKAKTNSDSSTMQGVTDGSAKRARGVSTSKSKSEAAKSGGKPKEDVRHSSKSKDDSPRTVNKSKVETPKTGSKLKEDAQKLGSKSKDDTAKIKSKEDTTKRSIKSKGETPKTGGKASANGTTAKAKSSSLKLQENEDSMMGKSDSAKAQESETKSGKKRARKING